MFGFMKNICGCDAHKSDDKETQAQKLQVAHEQDRQVRESLSEKQIDKGVNDSMIASDPVAKY